MQSQSSKPSKQHTFIAKLTEILSDPHNHPIINWESSLSFAVYDIEKFEKVTLPHYFRHSRFSSFVRQLNMYGFHKVRTNKTSVIRFHNQAFTKENADIADIGRKPSGMIGSHRPQPKCFNAQKQVNNSSCTTAEEFRPLSNYSSQPERVKYDDFSEGSTLSLPQPSNLGSSMPDEDQQLSIADHVHCIVQQIRQEENDLLLMDCDVSSRVHRLLDQYPYRHLNRALVLPFIYTCLGTKPNIFTRRSYGEAHTMRLIL